MKTAQGGKNPQGGKNKQKKNPKTRAGGYFQQQNATMECKRDQRQDPTQFSCQDETLPNGGGDEAAAEM